MIAAGRGWPASDPRFSIGSLALFRLPFALQHGGEIWHFLLRSIRSRASAFYGFLSRRCERILQVHACVSISALSYAKGQGFCSSELSPLSLCVTHYVSCRWRTTSCPLPFRLHLFFSFSCPFPSLVSSKHLIPETLSPLARYPDLAPSFDVG